MKLLALDVGTRRTGLAYADTNDGVAVALSTIDHQSFDELRKKLRSIITERRIDQLVLGLPLLPSGEEGAQAKTVRAFVSSLQKKDFPPCHLLDERYTTLGSSGGGIDPDASSATTILLTFLERNKDLT